MSDKILDRIRKLLAMAGDTSSPAEAAIAARRARKLMDEHQVSELDLTTVKDDDMGASDFDLGSKQTNRPMGVLATAVSRLNDCRVRYSRANGMMLLRFEGFLVDAVCAIEMLSYLKDEMYKQAERNADGRADRHAYRLGFASGVAVKIKEMVAERETLKTSDGTALVVVKNQLVGKRFGVQRYSRSKATFTGASSAFSNGKAQGYSTGMDRQVQGQTQRQLV